MLAVDGRGTWMSTLNNTVLLNVIKDLGVKTNWYSADWQLIQEGIQTDGGSRKRSTSFNVLSCDAVCLKLQGLYTLQGIAIYKQYQIFMLP